MKIVPLSLPGCFELQLNRQSDLRGEFIKIHHQDCFENLNVITDFKEEYFTVSKKTVIRGMHFQIPPHDCSKLVFCLKGTVLDVLVDLRNGSPMYGKYEVLELNYAKPNGVYLPSGIGHGFCVLSDEAILLYKTTASYSRQHDCGIRWDSFGFVWPEANPIISDRDKIFPMFEEFKSPFQYENK